MISKEEILKASKKFSNGLVLVNTTPHSLAFQEEDGTLEIIPSSVPEGEKTGPLVVTAIIQNQKTKNPYRIHPVLIQDTKSLDIINAINDEFKDELEMGTLQIIGSDIAARTYPGKIVGMAPVPTFERVLPKYKRMLCNQFTDYSL